MTFSYRDDAKLWIIQNQLRRHNVTSYARCLLFLILKDSVAAAKQRMLAGKTAPTQFSAQDTTRDILAKMAGVVHDILRKVETLELDSDDELKAKFRASRISIILSISQ